jgi:O-antigen/teichoic acid export membrane protein
LNTVLALKVPLAILTALVATGLMSISNKSIEIQTLVFIASAIMILDSFSLTLWVCFRAKHIMAYESIATVLVQIAIFTLGVIALKTTGQVVHLIMALLIASATNIIYAALLVRKKLGYRFKLRWQPEIVRYFLRILPAFALAGIFNKVYNAADSVMLSYFVGDEAVGFFSVPGKVVYALQQIIPAAFATALFPAFSFYYKHDSQKLRDTFLIACKYLLIISIPLTIGLVMLAQPMIDQLWPQYHAVIPTFVVMSCAIPFIFLAFPTGYLLNACDRQHTNTINRIIITIIAVGLNFILIKQHGYFGAGITFLITNVILLALDIMSSSQVFTLPAKILGSIVLKTSIATAAMALLLYALRLWPIIILVPISAILYFVVLFALKGFHIHEIKSIVKRNN